jgi:lambda family phage portal protein
MIYNAIVRALAAGIALVSPASAAKYLRGHEFLRGYSAGKSDDHLSAWSPKGTSSYPEVSKDWRRVVDRARDLERNNPYVAGMVKRWVAATVGEGMWPKAKVRLPNGSLDKVINRAIEERWLAWSENCGINGDSFSTIQKLASRHLLIDGEVLLHRVSTKEKPFALELLECDQLDTSLDQDKPNGNKIRGGIEFNRFGQPLFYWLFDAHPGDGITTSSVSRPVPADQISHIFERQRATQARGICLFASIITDIFDTLEYQDATMMLAKVATGFGVWIEKDFPEDEIDNADAGTAKDGVTKYKFVNPGGVHYLNKGEKLNQTKMENPGQTYDPYIKSRLRGASVGAGQPYSSFSGDYSESSYSSDRLALIQARAIDRVYQCLIDDKANLWTYRQWMQSEALITGGLKLPGFVQTPQKFYPVVFSRPRQEWIDPMKEAAAARLRLQIGLDSLTELKENEGGDIEETFATRSAEVARMKELGIWGIDVMPEVFGNAADQPPQAEGSPNAKKK